MDLNKSCSSWATISKQLKYHEHLYKQLYVNVKISRPHRPCIVQEGAVNSLPGMNKLVCWMNKLWFKRLQDNKKETGEGNGCITDQSMCNHRSFVYEVSSRTCFWEHQLWGMGVVASWSKGCFARKVTGALLRKKDHLETPKQILLAN